MKKILFFIESLSGGGAEQVLVTILRHMDYTKFDVTLVTVTDEGVHKGDIDLSIVHYKPLIKNSQNKMGLLWNMIKYKLLYQILHPSVVVKLMFREKYDINIAFVEGYCTKILSYLPKRNQKIAWVHCDLNRQPWTIAKNIYVNIKEERNAYSRYDKVVCVSRSLEQVMQQYYQLNNTITIYNPIDTEYIDALSKQPCDVKLSNEFNIVSVGRLVPEKGYDMLIPMIDRLCSEGVKTSLYILGEGEDRAKLELIIKEKHLEDSVHLLGFQSNPYAIVKRMDLFVCSSRTEGYSLVIAEALTMSIPVLSTNCSGPNELLANNQFGLLCNSYDELYDNIRKVITDKKICKDLQEKAFARRHDFKIQITIKQIEGILAHVS